MLHGALSDMSLNWFGREAPNGHRPPEGEVGFCTLAIHRPYRDRAKRLILDQPDFSWTVLTDDPEDFSELPAKPVHHSPTGPMATDYLSGRVAIDGDGTANAQPKKFRAAAAYHDKRFALIAARKRHRTAVFLDADARLQGAVRAEEFNFRPGLGTTPVVQQSIHQHLQECGSWRLPHLEALADHLSLAEGALDRAFFCKETILSFTEHPAEEQFFALWGKAADFMQKRGIFTGEGGVIGLAAIASGVDVDFESLAKLACLVEHEGGGAKVACPSKLNVRPGR